MKHPVKIVKIGGVVIHALNAPIEGAPKFADDWIRNPRKKQTSRAASLRNVKKSAKPYGHVAYTKHLKSGKTVNVASHGFKSIDRPAGGTQGGKWFEDADGTHHFGKHYGGESDRLASEHITNQLYRLFGASAPKTQLVSVDGKSYMMSEELKGKEAGSARALAKTSIKDHFILDAWLANWDVVGLDFDNVLINGTQAHRIDNGGALLWRAMGGRKDFPAAVGELQTMRNPSYPAGEVFGSLTNTDLRSQAVAFAAQYKTHKADINKLVDAAKFSATTSAAIKTGLHARAAWLEAYGNGSVSKALPKKDRSGEADAVKQQPTGKASKKVAGKNGKTRYSYPQEKDGEKEQAAAPPRGPTPRRVPDEAKPHQPPAGDPHELAETLGTSVQTLQRVAQRFRDNKKLKGRDGFVRFMLTSLRGVADKHKLDSGYFREVYDALTAKGS